MCIQRQFNSTSHERRFFRFLWSFETNLERILIEAKLHTLWQQQQKEAKCARRFDWKHLAVEFSFVLVFFLSLFSSFIVHYTIAIDWLCSHPEAETTEICWANVYDLYLNVWKSHRERSAFEAVNIIGEKITDATASDIWWIFFRVSTWKFVSHVQGNNSRNLFVIKTFASKSASAGEHLFPTPTH